MAKYFLKISGVILILTAMFYYILMRSNYQSSFIPKNINTFANRMPEIKSNTNWLLVSSDVYNFQQLRDLSKWRNWNLLYVVPQVDDNEQIRSLKNIIVLSDNELWSYGFKTSEHLRKNKKSRLILAALFALKNGAKWIYIGNSCRLPDESSFLLGETYPRLVSDEIKSFNPLRHFGIEERNLEGFVNLSSSDQSTTYFIRPTRPIVQHIIFEKEMDFNAPPVVIWPGSYSFFPVEGTLFGYDSFWSFIYESKDGYLSYYLQTMLKYMEGEMLFDRYQHDITQNKCVESSKIGINSEKILSGWQKWQCKSSRFTTCLKELNLLMEGVSAELIKDWIDDLKMIEYKYPQKIPDRSNSKELKNFKKMSFIPRAISKTKKKKQIERINNNFNKTCPKSNINNLATKKPQEKETLLIITFNQMHIRILPLLEILYRGNFPNILICGMGTEGWKLAKDYDLSFFQMDLYPYLNYTKIPQCILNAMKVGYRVKGYFNIHDDVMLNFWNIKSHNHSKIWYLPGDYAFVDSFLLKRINMQTFAVSNEDPPYFFRPKESKYRVVEALDKIRNTLSTSKLKCHQNLMYLTKGLYRYIHGQSDIFYIPSRLANDYLEVMSEFESRDVWFEISVPTVTRCIEHPNEHEVIPLGHIYGSVELRFNAYRFYPQKLGNIHIHPFKMEPILENDNERKSMFCDHVVPEIHKHTNK